MTTFKPWLLGATLSLWIAPALANLNSMTVHVDLAGQLGVGGTLKTLTLSAIPIDDYIESVLRAAPD